MEMALGQEKGKKTGQPSPPINLLEEEDDCPWFDYFQQLEQSIRPSVFIIIVRISINIHILHNGYQQYVIL